MEATLHDEDLLKGTAERMAIAHARAHGMHSILIQLELLPETIEKAREYCDALAAQRNRDREMVEGEV